MNKIVISENSSLEEIEQLNSQLIESGKTDFSIPKSLGNYGALGVEAHVLQLFATWLRSKNCSGTLIIPNNLNNNDEENDAFFSTLYSICSLALAKDIFNESGEMQKRRLLLDAAVKNIKAVREEDFTTASQNNSYIGLPSITSPGYHSEFKIPVYNNDQVVGREKFFYVVKNIITSITKKNPNNEVLTENLLGHISEIVRELFTNTHKHAMRDQFGNVLTKNFRCIVFNYAELTEEGINNWNKSPKKALYASQLLKKADNNNLPILDISVVDSGPGYARRWTGLAAEELSFKNERQAVLDCFCKYKSSDTISSAGFGLSNILRDIRLLEGWFRLRTGRVRIEKSYWQKEGKLKIESKDVKEESSFAEGVVFNIVIPLVPTVI